MTPDEPKRSARLAHAAALGAALLTLASVPARAVPMEGVGIPAARAREVLRRYPLRTLGGEAISLPSLRGQVVVVSFWASWCAPCRRELPRLDQLNAELSKKGGCVVAVSIDEDRENVDRFARLHALHLPIVHDGPQGLARSLDLQHIPFTVVLDRNGDVAYTSSHTDDAGLEALAATTRQLAARQPLATGIHEGDQP